MIAYVDSSVVARFVMRQPDRLRELATYSLRHTSLLTQIESLRVIEWARLQEGLGQDEVLACRVVLFDLLRRMQRLPVGRSVIERAGAPFPLPVKALDAIHLATALQLRERRHPEIVFATHDRQQARAALAIGFEVIGV